MTISEMNHILYDISYSDYVNQLKEKYGLVPKNYFYINRNGNLTKTPGITRGKEGLYIHHILEKVFIDLSNAETYLKLLDLYKDDKEMYNSLLLAQTSNLLCYCNLLEHLLLHIKATLEYKRNQFEVGIHLISLDLTRFYLLSDNNLLEKTYSAPAHKWKCQSYYNIKDDYKIYVELCKICILDLQLSPAIFLFDWYGNLYKKLFDDFNKDKRIKNIIDKDKQTQILLKDFYNTNKSIK